ncbi:hypothetical protein [Natronoflexus pectinivorans]|uniref:hypothetical protein n=1 Tax=Natronoflexus pectinivorans TaxID=682526 RepID=UPI0014047C38|nr:hypothetical protein [Natronoflexus pectinivorans]
MNPKQKTDETSHENRQIDEVKDFLTQRNRRSAKPMTGLASSPENSGTLKYKL